MKLYDLTYFFKKDYRLVYNDHYYKLFKGYHKIVYKSDSLFNVYNFIKNNKIDFHDVVIPAMSMSDFFNDWVVFDEEERL